MKTKISVPLCVLLFLGFGLFNCRIPTEPKEPIGPNHNIEYKTVEVIYSRPTVASPDRNDIVFEDFDLYDPPLPMMLELVDQKVALHTPKTTPVVLGEFSTKAWFLIYQ